MTQSLQGKTALVTGASRGIGRAIAQRLARSGAMVAVNYAASEQAARDTLASIEAEGGQAFLLQAELGTLAAAEQLATSLAAELTARVGDPGLDILVNNVGSAPYASIETTTPEIYEKTFANNVGATLWTTKALLGRLRQNGRVINISSGSSRLALAELLVYSMSKAAVDNFTRAMARQLGSRGITVNSILPGTVATDAAAGDLANAEVVQWLTSMTALGRPFGEPEEIADVVHALATPAMGWVTGQLIEASGGFRM